MGIFVLSQELPHPAGLVLASAAAVAVIAWVLCTKIPALAAICPWRKAPAGPAPTAG